MPQWRGCAPVCTREPEVLPTWALPEGEERSSGPALPSWPSGFTGLKVYLGPDVAFLQREATLHKSWQVGRGRELVAQMAGEGRGQVGRGRELVTQMAGGRQRAEARMVADAHLEEAVGVHVVHVHVDHAEQVLDLLEAHLTVLVGVRSMQIEVDPGVGAQEILETGWAQPPADR